MKITIFEESFQILLQGRTKTSHIIHFAILISGSHCQGDVRKISISAALAGIPVRKCLEKKQEIYRQISNINHTLIGNKIVDHSDVVGASPVGTAPTTSSFST